MQEPYASATMFIIIIRVLVAAALVPHNQGVI